MGALAGDARARLTSLRSRACVSLTHGARRNAVTARLDARLESQGRACTRVSLTSLAVLFGADRIEWLPAVSTHA
jgi:hypothetical protein